MAIPMAVPTIPDSASGVSNTRASPNAAASPSVTRNTPPRAPTSSPKTTTVSIVAQRVGQRPVQGGGHRHGRRRGAGVRVPCSASAVIARPRLVGQPWPVRPPAPAAGCAARASARRRRTGTGRPGPVTGSAFIRCRRSPAAVSASASRADRAASSSSPRPSRYCLIRVTGSRASQAWTSPGRPVAGGVVGVGVGLDAVGDRLDEGRPAAGGRRLHGLADRRVHRGRIVAVHEHAGDPVADSLVGQGRGGGLLGQRDADRVAVVLHEEHDRRVPRRRRS